MAKGKKALHELKYRNTKQISVFFSLFGYERKNFILALILLTIKHSPAMFLPIIIGNVINAIIAGGPQVLHKIIMNTLFITFLLLQNIPTHTYFIKFLSNANRSIEKGLRSSLVKRMQELSIAFHDRFESGRLQSKVLRDVESVEILYRQAINSGFTAMLNIVFAMAATLIHNYWVALFYTLTVPLSAILLKLFRKRMMQSNEEYRTQIELMSSRVSEMVQMIPIARAHGIEDKEIQHIDNQLEHVKEKGIKLDIINAFFGASSWVVYQLFQFMCLLVTGIMAYRKIISVGDVVMYQGFFALIVNSVNTIINVFPELNRGFDSLKSLGEVLECPDIEDNRGKKIVKTVAGNVVFDHVSFSYTGKKNVISDFSLEVKPGQCIAFVGESGAGKSTLISLLIGYRRPVQGRILLDGVNMNELDLRTFRRFISVVPQNVVLFSGTIRQNILYGLDQERADEEHIRKVIRIARVDEFVNELEEGLETRIGEHGNQLSGGQKQRIAIARALIRDPRIILFDEATSALDIESEQLIQEALNDMIRKRTTFMIAHRLSTIRRADTIVVLENGRLIERGNHNTLLQEQGIYYRMHSLL
jgi:ATP-binding cassette subfamily B protein